MTTSSKSPSPAEVSQGSGQGVRGADLSPGLVGAAKMNMVMNNDGSGGLWQANPHTWEPAVADQLALGSFDLVVTNPPFGANIVIDDEGVLEQYDLAARREGKVGGPLKRPYRREPLWQTRSDELKERLGMRQVLEPVTAEFADAEAGH